MNEFNFNLCRVLAHTLVFEKQEEERAVGVAAGYFRNDTPSPPPTPNYGQQTSETLAAQVAEAPAEYAANAEFSPQYTALDLSNLETALGGTPGTPGFLSEYSNTILPTLTAADTTAQAGQAAGTVNTLGTLGPAAAAAFGAVNPGGTALQSLLTKTATNQLNLGTQLDPNSVNQINSSVNANWANRGLGTSSPAMLDDALQLNAGGQNLLQTRESNAGAVSGQDYSQMMQPLMALLGQPTTAVGTAGSITGTGSGLVGSVPNLNPESPYAGNLYDEAYNATAASNIAGANETDSLIGGGISAL